MTAESIDQILSTISEEYRQEFYKKGFTEISLAV
jgi:hypothetical protein